VTVPRRVAVPHQVLEQRRQRRERRRIVDGAASSRSRMIRSQAILAIKAARS